MQTSTRTHWFAAAALAAALSLLPEAAARADEARAQAQVDGAMQLLAGMPQLTAAREDYPSKSAKFVPGLPVQPDKGAKGGKGLKLDEPGGSIALGVTPGLACPGFYVLTIGDGPEPGIQPGSYGAELLLLAPGSRVLAGGLNFGGEMDASAPGYAAFTIANPASENQRVDIQLTGFRAMPGNPNIRLQVTLERRLPTPQTIISQVVTVGQNSPYVSSTTVSPGFYVATVAPLDPLSGADGIFGMSLLSNYVDRPGGGFQGGVVVGGYHDPAASATSGFAGFCLADAHTVQMRTEGRPTRGPAGAGDLRVVVANAGGSVVYANPVAGPSGDDHGNNCSSATPVTLNSTFSGFLAPTSDVDYFRFTLSGNTAVTAQASSVFDSLGTLYDANCMQIAEDDDGAGNLDFRLQRTLPAGTWYLRVASFGGASGGSYQVAISGVATGDDHGDSCATATGVSVGTTFGGSLSPSTDVDFFRFTLGSTTTVTAAASSTFDSLGTLYDSNCSFVAADDDSGGDLDFRLQRTLSAGTWYLRVSSFSSASSGNYTVALSGSAQSNISATVRITNYLIYPVRVRANGVLLGTAAGSEVTQFPYTGSASVTISWELVRQTIAGTSTAIGDTMDGSFAPATFTQGAIEGYIVDNVLGANTYFVPVIDNLTPATLLMGVNVGLSSQNLCNCTVWPFEGNISIGYYRLFSNSNVRAYRATSNYTGPYIYWGSDPSGSTTPLVNLAQVRTGMVTLTATMSP
jgi:hypothetical protein